MTNGYSDIDWSSPEMTLAQLGRDWKPTALEATLYKVQTATNQWADLKPWAMPTISPMVSPAIGIGAIGGVMANISEWLNIGLNMLKQPAVQQGITGAISGLTGQATGFGVTRRRRPKRIVFSENQWRFVQSLVRGMRSGNIPSYGGRRRRRRSFFR